MADEKKDYRTSVRMTPTVYNYVMAQPDPNERGFNQKFEGMVLYCMAEKTRIDAEIADATAELKRLEKRIADSKKILSGIDGMKWNLEQVIRTAESIAKGCGVEQEKTSLES